MAGVSYVSPYIKYVSNIVIINHREPLIILVNSEPKLDGRPMSGDIGRGATRESIAFAARLAAVEDKPRGLCRFALLCIFCSHL